MRLSKLFVSLAIIIGMLVTALPGADALYISFGDSSWSYGTPLDDDDNRTVCSDGFTLLVASTPNDAGDIGDPTDNPGSTKTADQIGVFGAALIDDNLDSGGFFTPLGLSQAGVPGGFTYIDIATAQPAADLFGFLQVDVVVDPTYSSVEGIPKAVEGTGSAMFVPTSPLPIGEDVVIVTGGLLGFGSHRRVTVVDCSVTPLDVEVIVRKDHKIKADRPYKRFKVEIINDGTFDIRDVADLAINGNSVDANRSTRVKVRDLDHDGDLDLLIKMRMKHTDIECGDTSVSITGTVDGEPFETVVPITTKCKK